MSKNTIVWITKPLSYIQAGRWN